MVCDVCMWGLLFSSNRLTEVVFAGEGGVRQQGAPEGQRGQPEQQVVRQELHHQREAVQGVVTSLARLRRRREEGRQQGGPGRR